MEVGSFNWENDTIIVRAGWEQMDKVREILLAQKTDCNAIGRCGFNLLHLYIVRSLLIDDDFHMLMWWANMPMVDCNTYSLLVSDRPRITMLHPSELVKRVVSLYPETKRRAIKVMSFLMSRGMLCDERDKWIDPNNIFIVERYTKQKMERIDQDKLLVGTMLPTPQMNDLADIPFHQHLLFTSSSNGRCFYFHASYMDSIFKTHLFPFTLEPIHSDTIHNWLRTFENEWMPREEFVSAMPSLCHECVNGMDADKMFVHWLSDWITPIYPYSRIIHLSTFALTEKMYEYMCLRLRAGVFHLRPFHNRRRHNISWKQFFLWSCYDCINEFFFANQMEELISALMNTSIH